MHVNRKNSNKNNLKHVKKTNLNIQSASQDLKAGQNKNYLQNMQVTFGKNKKNYEKKLNKSLICKEKVER